MTSTTVVPRDADVLRALAGRIDPGDPGAWNNLGVLYHSKGLYAEAVDAFLAALAVAPRMRQAARNLELVAREDSAIAPRLAAIATRLAANPDDRAVRHEEARLLRLIGRRDEARRALEALIAADPDDAVVLHERGLLEQQTGDLARAQRWFERAADAAPRDVLPRLHLAEILYHRGRNDQALAALEALLALDPACAEAHLLMGFVLGDIGRADDALRATHRATALDPSLARFDAALAIDADGGTRTAAGAADGFRDVLGVVDGGTLARYGLGLAFRQRGYFAEARREFERARDAGEDQRLVAHALAELDLLAGDHDAARRAYAELTDADPGNPRFWNEAGVAWHQAGHLAGAMERYRRALRCDPRHPLAYNNLGVALVHADDARGARQAFERAIELDAGLVTARLNLARWFVRASDPLAALAVLREVTAFHPGHADGWHELGRVLDAVGRLEEAREALVTAIDLRPAHAEARYMLGQLLGRLGDHDGAARETQLAMRHAPMRTSSRFALSIDLQHECPDAVAAMDLLALRATAPLAGTAVRTDDLDRLLPDPAPAPPVSGQRAAGTSGPEEALHALLHRVRTLCDAGDRHAERGLHGEARERYAQARQLLAPRCRPAGNGNGNSNGSGSTSAAAHAIASAWRRAVLGEARSACLVDDGAALADDMAQLALEAGDDPEVLALLAATHAVAADGHETARSALQALAGRDPDSAALQHFAGDVATTLGDAPLAMRFYRRALAVDPGRPTPRVAIARLLRGRGDLDAAHLELAAALAAAPGMRDAALELARVHRDAGRPGAVVAVLRAHLVRDPTDCDALALLADALIAQRRHDDAAQVLQRLQRHDPDHATALLLDGWLLARRGHRLIASARWNRLLAHAPDSPEAARARRWLQALVTRRGVVGPTDAATDAPATGSAQRRAPSMRSLVAT
jgi:tetratricopeptide (TPR) repeat protein